RRRARTLVSPPRADRGRGTPRRRRCPRRHLLHAALDPRPAHPLGELLARRRDELQLAAPARSRRDPRLRRRARGGAPRGAGPLAPLLAAGRGPLPCLPRARALAAAP